MTEINTTLEEQIGGWFNVSVATLDELVVCPDILTNANARSIVITPKNDGLEILPVGENIQISEPVSKTKAGLVYTIKGEFDISYQSQAIDTYLNNLLLKKVVLIGIKHSGQQKLYGSKKFPLLFSYQHINGKKAEDGNKTRITVQGKIPQKPVFIND